MEQLRSNYENLSSDSTNDLTNKLSEKQSIIDKLQSELNQTKTDKVKLFRIIRIHFIPLNNRILNERLT